MMKIKNCVFIVTFLFLIIFVLNNNLFPQFKMVSEKSPDTKLFLTSKGERTPGVSQTEHRHFKYQTPESRQLDAESKDSLNVRLVGRWTNGTCLAVTVIENIAYLGNGSYLEIVDFSNPAQPVEIGKIKLAETIMGIKASGNYAFVANGLAGLRIIDISDPYHPTEIGFYDTPDRASGLDISGTFVYLADGEKGLHIIDVSNPFTPKLTSSYDTHGRAIDIATSGQYTYIADEAAGLRVIDVSNPARPIEVGNYVTSGNAIGVAITSHYACVAAQFNGLRVIDISDPYKPTEIGFYDTNGAATGVAVNSSYAYIADGPEGLRIVDISNPYKLQEIGFYNTAGNAYDIALGGNFAYLADGRSGLCLVDISNPFQPGQVSHFNTTGHFRNLTRSGNYAYIANGEVGLRILDVSIPALPIEVGSLGLPGLAEDVVVDGKYAYVTNHEHGLRVIDVSNLKQPKEVGAMKQNINAFKIAIKENYAYIADWTTGLKIIDISNPSQPDMIGSFPVPGKKVNDVAIKGKYIYLAADNDGLIVVDISIPTRPIQLGVLVTNGTAISIDVTEQYAYVGLQQNALQIIDIQDPAQPIVISTFATQDTIYDVMIKTRYVFLANARAGLRIIDVFNPLKPVEVGYYQTGNSAHGVTVDERYIHLADESDGLYILDFLAPPINIVPGPPTLISPANNGFINKVIPKLTWQIPVDENKDFLHFKVEMDSDNDWSSVDYVIESKNNSTGFSPTPPVPQASGAMNYMTQAPLSENDWYWRIIAWDGTEYGQYSDTWHFTVDITPPVLDSLAFENPGFDENWFNPDQDSFASLVVSYDELYPASGSLTGAILLDTLQIFNLAAGYDQEVRISLPISNEVDGSYALLMSIQDSAQNIGSKAVTINLDRTAPYGYYSDAPDTIPAGQQYVVHVMEANDGMGSGVATIYLDGFTTISDIPITAQDSLSGFTKPGIFYYRYFAVDHLGNRGEIKTDTTVVIPVYPAAPLFPFTPTTEIKAGEEFWLYINAGTEQQPVQALFKAGFILNYSNTNFIDTIQDSILPGNLLGTEVIFNSRPDDAQGKITIDIQRKSGNQGAYGSGTLARIKYKTDPKTPNQTPVNFTLSAVSASDSAGNAIKLIPEDKTIWIIQPLSDFTMSIEPDSQTMNVGDSVAFAISFIPLGEFNSPISLEISALPPGMAAIAPSEPFLIPASFELKFTTTEDIMPGLYHPVITAAGGGLTHQVDVAIKVLPGPDFFMTVVPDSQAIRPGESVQFILTFQPSGGFDAPIRLKISNLPPGMDVIYPSEPFVIPTTFEIQFRTTDDLVPGIYRPIITATGGGITQQVTIIINVLPGPDFIMTIIPDSQAVSAGEKIEFEISFEPVGGFNSKIAVQVSNVPTGMGVIFSSRPFEIPAYFKFTFTTLKNIPPDVYYPIVTAGGGGITHQETVAINVLPGPVTQAGPQPNIFTPNDDGFNDYVEFRYPEIASGNGTVFIFDVDGRKITEIRNSNCWSGKDDSGKTVKPGVYVYIIKIGEKVIARGAITVAL